MAVVLEAKNLCKSFGAVTAAADITVALEHDTVTGLIGTNGAGKTTFINMITGYLKPSSGSVFFHGRDITALSPRAITRLGMGRSFQIPQLYDTLTVRENLLVGLGIAARYHAVDAMGRGEEESAQRLLERFGLEPYHDRAARVLPQGVRKLLDIALAMVARPQVLLLDEPTSGVSADEKFAIMDMIMEALRRERVTIMFVEHDMDIVLRYAQRVLAFYDGRIIGDGDPVQVLADQEVARLVVGKFAGHGLSHA